MHIEDEAQDSLLSTDESRKAARARIVALAVGIAILCSFAIGLSSMYYPVDAFSAGFAAFLRHTSLPLCTLSCANGGVATKDCSSCVCNAGWMGERCDLPLRCGEKSLSTCQNGGWRDMTSDDCSCLCPPGFSGVHCTERVDANPNEQVDFLNSLLDKVEEEDKRRAALFNPLLPSSVGYGRHPYTGKIALPLVVMEAGPEVFDLNGDKYIVPAGMTVDTSVAVTAPVTTVWQSIQAYLTSILTWPQNGPMVPTPLSEVYDSYDELLVNFFASGTSLGQVRYSVPLYKLTATNPDLLREKALSPSVQQAFNYLASFTYPERQDLYYTLLSRVGTCVVWESVNGGAIERISKMKPGVWNIGGGIDLKFVIEQLEINWHSGRGSGQWTHSNPLFKREVDWVRQSCKGGNSIEGDCMEVVVSEWQSQLYRMPLPILDQVVPVSHLVKDDNLKANLEAALPAFLDSQKARFVK